MIVTFCGHSQVADAESVRAWLYKTIEDLIGNGADIFYLGGYGDFDSLCASVVRELKKTYPHIKSILVLPYPDKYFDIAGYDETLYPPLESTPRRYCILKRNQWMVENADVVVSYIDHDWGGAVKTYNHAKRKGKQVINYAV